MKKSYLTLLLSLIVIVTIWVSQGVAEAYFTKDRLQFKNNSAWIPTTTASGTKAIRFVGTVLTLKDGTIIDSDNKTVLHYVAPFVGAIMAFSVTNTANIPTSWLICDGSEVKKVDYPILFQAIGTRWGTTIDPAKFKLPDLRNFFIRGADNFGTSEGAANRDTSTRYRTIGFSGSGSGVGSFQPSEIANHTHTLSIPQTINASTTDHNHSITNLLNNHPIESDDPENELFNNFGNDETSTSTSHGTITHTVGSHTHTLTFTEDSTFIGNSDTTQQGLPKRMYLVYCIKYEPI